MEKVLYLLLALGLLGLLSSTVYCGMVLLAAMRFYRRRYPAQGDAFTPPVSLLKPLHGAEPGLEASLATFFQQDYPSYEILFCARSEEDAGLEAARRVAHDHPQVPTKFLISGEPFMPNAKILSLDCMAQAANHNILIISDSDVRVERNYLREVVAPFAHNSVGAVTCLYRGVVAGQGGFWSQLEAAAMSIEMTAGVLVAEMLEGMKFALGPTMAVRRSCVDEIGGFLPMGDYCSDDFLLGNRIAARGHVVALSHHIIDHIVLHSEIASSIRHQARWMKSTRFSRPKGHLGTALTFSVPFGVFTGAIALALHQPLLAAAALAWSIGTRMLMAAAISRAVLREPSPWQSVLLYPVRDFLGIFFWAASYGSRKILWRNEIYLLGAEGRMQKLKSDESSKAARF